MVAWGVLAIGGVYPWAYYPLLGAAVASGSFELWRGPEGLTRGPVRLIGGVLLLLGCLAILAYSAWGCSMTARVLPLR